LLAQIQGGFTLRSVAATVAPAEEEEPECRYIPRVVSVPVSDSDSDSDDSDDWSD
jgi:hypothetical protein